jgi:MFS family permease
MTAVNWMSHGTQDIYPTYLKEGLDIPSATATWIIIGYNIGAILAGTVVGTLSERFGRRRMIILCGLAGLPLVPLFAYSPKWARSPSGRSSSRSASRAPGVSSRRISPSSARTRSAASTPA